LRSLDNEDGNSNSATDNVEDDDDGDDDDGNDGDDDSDGTADDDDDNNDDNEDVDDDNVDDENLPPCFGKMNEGCDKMKSEEEERVTDSAVIHTAIKQITGWGGGRW